MGDSQTICCCNIFRAAKGLTIAEIVLIFLGVIFGFGRGLGSGICWTLLQLAYLAVEFYGIHKENKFLILFGCVIRIMETISLVILIIVFYAVPICPNMLGRNACDELRSQIAQQNDYSQSGFTDDQVFDFGITTFRTSLLVLLSIELVWLIFRSHVQVKVYRVVKQE